MMNFQNQEQSETETISQNDFGLDCCDEIYHGDVMVFSNGKDIIEEHKVITENKKERSSLLNIQPINGYQIQSLHDNGVRPISASLGDLNEEQNNKSDQIQVSKSINYSMAVNGNGNISTGQGTEMEIDSPISKIRQTSILKKEQNDQKNPIIQMQNIQVEINESKISVPIIEEIQIQNICGEPNQINGGQLLDIQVKHQDNLCNNIKVCSNNKQLEQLNEERKKQKEIYQCDCDNKTPNNSNALNKEEQSSKLEQVYKKTIKKVKSNNSNSNKQKNTTQKKINKKNEASLFIQNKIKEIKCKKIFKEDSDEINNKSNNIVSIREFQFSQPLPNFDKMRSITPITQYNLQVDDSISQSCNNNSDEEYRDSGKEQKSQNQLLFIQDKNKKNKQNKEIKQKEEEKQNYQNDLQKIENLDYEKQNLVISLPDDKPEVIYAVPHDNVIRDSTVSKRNFFNILDRVMSKLDSSDAINSGYLTCQDRKFNQNNEIKKQLEFFGDAQIQQDTDNEKQNYADDDIDNKHINIFNKLEQLSQRKLSIYSNSSSSESSSSSSCDISIRNVNISNQNIDQEEVYINEVIIQNQNSNAENIKDNGIIFQKNL